MAGLLQKILGRGGQNGAARGRAVQARPGSLPTRPGRKPSAPGDLPNATIIYGIGASLMFVASFFLLIHGRFFPSCIVFAVGVCLVGFAVHLMKHQD